LKISQNRG